MAKAFEFADFVEEFKVEFTLHKQMPGYEDTANGNKWIPGGVDDVPSGGIVLPLGEDDLKNDVNGTYTEKDRKIYTTEPLKIGDSITYDGQRFKIHQEKDYKAYADVFIYFAKGEGATE